MRVLVACEYSGTVRDAFTKLGHYAMSCDLLDSDTAGPHHKGDVFDVIDGDWDLMVAHPPCTHLAVSGAAWFKYKQQEQKEALDFVSKLMWCKIPRICIENPVSIISTRFRKPEQIIQPWMFGHTVRKTTCLWLTNLPKLVPTTNLEAEVLVLPKAQQNPLHWLPPSADRGKLRSKTYQGIADAMAQQWGPLNV